MYVGWVLRVGKWAFTIPLNRLFYLQKYTPKSKPMDALHFLPCSNSKQAYFIDFMPSSEYHNAVESPYLLSKPSRKHQQVKRQPRKKSEWNGKKRIRIELNYIKWVQNMGNYTWLRRKSNTRNKEKGAQK